MTPALAAGLQIAAVVIVLAAAYVPLGDHMARVFITPRDERARDEVVSSAARQAAGSTITTTTTLDPPKPTSRSVSATADWRVEYLLYRVCRIDPRSEQTWVGYALSLLGFSAAGVFFLYALQRVQGVLPLNNSLPGVSPSVAFNTAISFVTNTNWQSYSPETTMSNLTQPLGLAVQNFVSAAVGLAVAVAVIRGFVRVRSGGELGNFWVDLTRGVLRILLPLSFVVALILLTQGVVMSFHSGFASTGLDGSSITNALAPVASQEAIKELGTNGGGILAANSAHPFENPTPLSNIVEIIALLLVPVALTRTFGTLVGERKQGLSILAVMALLWAGILAVTLAAESGTRGVAAQAAGAMMEGKEQRFGIPGSALFAVSTTGTSTGAVNSAHDAMSPLGGGVVILNMLFGEVAPGGVGTGLYGMLVLAVIAVFVGGLLVGRTPEYLGKKLGKREITMAALSVLVMPALVLIGTGVTVILGSTSGALGNSGDPGTPGSIHGFSEVLYAYASASNNNGSAFGGLTVTDDWFQTSLGIAMLLGRFLPIVFVLALAGSLVTKRRSPAGPGTLPTTGLLFAGLLTGTIVLVAALTFFPALALGPFAEALQ
ncbi:potassium-transporting ATPase subunit KdpA [Rhodococcus sp. BP-149]|uniref:potassium-transporting ATPase subunit KdpA n=1 Tax=unclassified Rhodococcus (in: high G+C Gram-positive bacteria) TaxID=192944 RepID=UPI001C9B68F7|nr:MULTISPECIES: potassium-transporting ATPase subunit KdpA [unclassified Rhodococcus (in: high G+C Gram-positive bacteria)]MBY6685884.1 potassium-transporting ATPase subunit KdpA [Rhodococcus sp. BP-288]MBY6694568.1 potassium-transporting ATPase subunit KdpA [Rhodococcus sp. BP-188]MBY6699448.1 potassium-transporting ATPase subunit KdpA [Rhodococcus sp. BP-285]MBY6703056.1 potassium-transporting ATPase subunit KdpA [Rhodococcus sp. BP-283]MBY6711364.1 potassium-transporting ATPase subunit Kdp